MNRQPIFWTPSERQQVRAFTGGPGRVIRWLVGSKPGLVVLALQLTGMTALGVSDLINGKLPIPFAGVVLAVGVAFRLNRVLRKLLAFDPRFFDRTLSEQWQFTYYRPE